MMDKFWQAVELLKDRVTSPCDLCEGVDCPFCENYDCWCLCDVEAYTLVEDIFKIGGIEVEVE